MKKIIFLILVTALISGCSNDQYAIERRYYRLSKQAGKIFANPHVSPPQELERVVKLLNSFAKKYPKSNLALDAEFNIARLYIVKEEYTKARAYLKQLLNQYSAQSKAVSSEIIFLMGNSFEIENKWGLALEQYKKIMQEYPLTIRGINVPIYIAQHYKIKYQPDKMIASYQEAIGHYKALAAQYPGSPLGFNTEALAAQCYIAMKEWGNAIDTFNNLIAAYKSKINLDAVMLDMALIYQRELKDNVKAKETLEKLIKDYPKSRLVKIANELLKKVGEK